MPTRPFIIGIDFDDVLIGSADRTTELYNELYGTHLTRDDWYDDPSITAPWAVDSFSEIVQRVVEVHSMKQFEDVQPIQDAQGVLQALKAAGHTLIIITGRPVSLRSETERLVDKYYKDIVDTLYFTDHFSHEGQRVSKADITSRLGLTHFIDDVIQHANDVSRTGVKTILFSHNYKWNQAPTDEAVLRLSSWKEIGAFFNDEQRTTVSFS